MTIQKKVVLITGGTSGIGLGTIEYLLEQTGYTVISASRGNENISLAQKKLGSNANNLKYMMRSTKNLADWTA